MRFFLAIMLICAATCAIAQSAPEQSPAPGAYQAKFAGDKAHSDAEFSALGYMRTVVVADKLYYRKHNKYADSLTALVGSGSFTRRMTKPDRGDYTVSYRAKPEGYALTLVPRQMDAAHRSFYVDESGEFRADDSRRASEKSEPMK